MVRRIPSRQRNARVVRERDRGSLLRLGLLLCCGLTLAGGFVYAGVQHFAALRLGYQTENLRKVRNQLAEERRLYLLEREAATSPARLERAARQLGMQTLQAAQIDPLKRTVAKSTEKNSPPTSVAPAAQKTQVKVIRQSQPAEPRSQPANQIQARVR
jgi:cell division protein FtsL